MAQDINNFIDPNLVAEFEKLNQQIIDMGTNLDKFTLPQIKKLESELSKLSKTTGEGADKKKQLTEAEKEALKIQQQLENSEKKLNSLKEESTKKLIQNQLAYQKQKSFLQVF